MDDLEPPVPLPPGADRLINEQEQLASPISLELEGLPWGRRVTPGFRRIALGSLAFPVTRHWKARCCLLPPCLALLGLGP